MTPLKRSLHLAALALLSAATCMAAADWTDGMQRGRLELKSAGPLTFGPDGILFIADAKSASIAALATGDLQPSPGPTTITVDGLDRKVAALLGTSPDQILIDDLAVNPASKAAYLAVSRGRGAGAKPVLIRVRSDGKLEVVSLDDVRFSKAVLPDPPADATVTQGNRQSNPRQESITDISFFEDRLLIAGLSNEEFASTFRAVPFPFRTVPNGTSVEIYHGAHGRFETRAPIRTFVPFNIGHEPHLLAAYTCTPLVEIPISSVKPGARVKGKTIAELGNRNRPLDMIVYQKNGKDYLLLANNSRGVMKISTDSIASNAGIESPVPDGNTKGQSYETVAGWKGIDQLDKLDSGHALVLKRVDGGGLALVSLPLP